MFIIQVQELHLMTFFRDSLLVVHFLNPSVILAKKPDKLKSVISYMLCMFYQLFRKVYYRHSENELSVHVKPF